MRKPATAARSPPRQRQRPTPSGRGTLVPGWVRSAVLVWSAEVAAVGWCETAADNQSEAKLSGERIGRFALGKQQRGGGVHGQQRCDDRDAHARLRHPPHRASRRDDRDAAAVRSAMSDYAATVHCAAMQLPRCSAQRFSSAVRSPHSFVRKLSSTGDYLSPSKSHRCVVAPLWLRGAAACDERRMVASSSAWCAVQCGDRTALWHNSRARNAARSGTHRWLRPCAAGRDRLRPAPPRA